MPLSELKVGFIGLGLMGAPMAANLQKKNAVLTVYNRTATKCDSFARSGATVATTPKDLAEKVEDGIIVICVSDTASMLETMHGNTGVLVGLSPGATIIDMGTSEVSATRKVAADVAALGGRFVDAPVSGGEVGAKAATLSIMAGGDVSHIARAMPIFDVLGASVTHIGPIGTGQAAKVANQMIVGVTVCAVAEALALAKAAGADTAQVRKALLSGFAGSRILELHGQRMIDETYIPGARATTQLKDLHQALALADDTNMTLPMMTTCRHLWAQMVDAGLGDLDQSGYAQFVKTLQKD